MIFIEIRSFIMKFSIYLAQPHLERKKQNKNIMILFLLRLFLFMTYFFLLYIVPITLTYWI